MTPDVLVVAAAKLPHQLARTFIEIRRDLHFNRGHQIARRLVAVPGQTLARKSELASRDRAGRHLEPRAATCGRGHFDARTKERLMDGDRDRQVHVATHPPKDGVRVDVDRDVEIAGWSTACARVTFPRHRHA